MEPSSWCPVRTRSNGQKLKHRRFGLNIRKHFFTMKMTEHWHKLANEMVESPSLKTFKIHLDVALAISSRWPCLSRYVASVKGSLPETSRSDQSWSTPEVECFKIANHDDFHRGAIIPVALMTMFLSNVWIAICG